jgi:CHAD domain-containing protein
LKHLALHLPVARAGLDPEGVHQVRVAVCRLRVWLDLGGLCVLDDDLRWLRHGVAKVRDLDVQLQHQPPKAWAEKLRQRRAREHAALCRLLDDRRLKSLLTALELLPSVPRARARRGLASIAAQTLRRGRAAEKKPRDLPELHRLRGMVRWLRYALDWLGEDSRRLEGLQDALGTAFDRYVALKQLGHPGPGSQLHRFHRDLASQLRETTRIAHLAWKDTRPWVEALL